MALELTKKSNFGIDATYWYIATFEKLSFKDKECAIILHGFSDKTCREGKFILEGKMYNNSPLAVCWFHFNGADFDFDYTDNVTEKAYIKIKKIVDWKDAKDV